MAYLHTAGQTTIFNSSSTGPGAWVQVHPKMKTLTFQVNALGTSVGATINSTVWIEASNDGVNPLITKLGTVVFTTIRAPAVDGFTINAAWNFIRGNIQSMGAEVASVNIVANGARD